ncbi:hypothetical protein [Halalkalibacter akibai]|uniref:Uncharacterized protein n=1 Tax=Halalkalibacter akibai (strain ATCC 43226 / DSM 21942 / CIP 109018 / JCM 9157 / 1139) TaxID=1236973 RepID=W4QS21_HALA3|nr:hypothetical protein [Halalkalibacter akibai]GAE34732.1 hypothetical protein JCM9157_1809 [Halalkalibacter akibai JCM 9157]
MFKGKAFCEASIHLFSKPDVPEQQLQRRIDTISRYKSPTVLVTGIDIVKTAFDESYGETVTSLSVKAEVLVKYDPEITHLNDYRVRACTILREQLPRSGAIMAHSIDTYSPLREEGFTTKERG